MRTQHYVFAHQGLRDVFFRRPSAVLEVLRSPAGPQWLRDLWDASGAYAEPGGERGREGLCHSFEDFGAGVIVVIHPPPPTSVPECHFVGLFAQYSDENRPALDRLDWVRILTLEYSLEVDTGRPIAMLCEWLEDGTHRNHGVADFEPKERSFVGGVLGIMQTESEATRS